MKKQITYVDASKIESLVTELGLPMLAQAGFVKVSGAKGRNVYIAKTKRVGRVDLSGFEMAKGTEGVVDLGGESFGAVHQQVDFTRPEADILATLRAVLKHMTTLGAREITRKPPVARANAAKGWSAPLTAAAKTERLETIKKAAKRNAKPDTETAHIQAETA